MGRRTLLLIAALLIAALGTALIWLYVQGADDRARNGLATVSVYTAGDSYAANTTWDSIQQGTGVPIALLKDVPQNILPDNPVTIANAAALAGKVLRHPVDKQSVLTTSMFINPGDATSSTGLDDKKLGIEVSLEDPARVAGLLQPGSEITIFATFVPAAIDSKGAVVAKDVVTWVFLDRVKVLSSGGNVGTTVAKSNGTTSPPQALVGLQVNVEEARKIILTQADETHVKLWFALRGSKADVTPGSKTTGADITGEFKP